MRREEEVGYIELAVEIIVVEKGNENTYWIVVFGRVECCFGWFWCIRRDRVVIVHARSRRRVRFHG